MLLAVHWSSGTLEYYPVGIRTGDRIWRKASTMTRFRFGRSSPLPLKQYEAFDVIGVRKKIQCRESQDLVVALAEGTQVSR